MERIMFAILLLFVGLISGFGLTMLVSVFKENAASKKIAKMLDDAQKNAEKLKRDSIMEAKEKNYQLKSEFDKEVKEKKSELKENETSYRNIR